ncbi:MAG TPA: hypothetical protein PKO33_03895 [Pyrinomonadaceae bacterium]|nr:hypothetical protein [Pyrinomonadaceae bacterium]
MLSYQACVQCALNQFAYLYFTTVGERDQSLAGNAFSASVRPDDGGDSVAGKDNFGVVGKGFETSDLETLELEHSYALIFGKSAVYFVGLRVLSQTPQSAADAVVW